jgi:hypothetical protein
MAVLLGEGAKTSDCVFALRFDIDAQAYPELVDPLDEYKHFC